MVARAATAAAGGATAGAAAAVGAATGSATEAEGAALEWGRGGTTHPWPESASSSGLRHTNAEEGEERGRRGV